MVSPSDPRSLIWRGQYGVDFLSGQIAHQPFVRSFFRNSQDTSDNADAGWIAQSYDMEEGSNRGKPCVSRADLVVTFCFKTFKKVENRGCIQILNT